MPIGQWPAAIVASAIPGAAAQGVPDFAAIVAALDRTEADRMHNRAFVDSP